MEFTMLALQIDLIVLYVYFFIHVKNSGYSSLSTPF
jgi:hypothetical protein